MGRKVLERGFSILSGSCGVKTPLYKEGALAFLFLFPILL